MTLHTDTLTHSQANEIKQVATCNEKVDLNKQCSIHFFFYLCYCQCLCVLRPRDVTVTNKKKPKTQEEKTKKKLDGKQLESKNSTRERRAGG